MDAERIERAAAALCESRPPLPPQKPCSVHIQDAEVILTAYGVPSIETRNAELEQLVEAVKEVRRFRHAPTLKAEAEMKLWAALDALAAGREENVSRSSFGGDEIR